jgi:ribosomal protein S12 methylthiotransferase
MLKFGLVTLGCDKNTVDSERYLADLVAHGAEAVTDLRDADVVVVNTCGFIDAAKAESIEAIVDAARLKDDGRVKAVFAIGCMIERHKDELVEALPEVDVFLGTSETDRLIPELVERGLLGGSLVEHPGVRLFSGDAPHVRYLKISEGCDHGCAFCAIPLMRGKHRSFALDDLVREAQLLEAQGAREINLVAQDLAHYGRDRRDGHALPELLEALVRETSIPWIRNMYLYSTGITPRLLEVIAANPRIVRYLDTPMQHGSDAVLARMRRPERQKTIRERLATYRAIVPDLAVRTSVIVGFPGETEDDFVTLCDFLEEMQFDRVGVFTYSPQEGTRAYGMEDDVADSIKQERKARIEELQRAITAERYERFLGTTARVLVERVGEETGTWTCRAPWQADDIDGLMQVDVPAALGIGTAAPHVVPGAFVDVRVDQVVDDFDFRATLLSVADVPATAPVNRPARTLPLVGMSPSTAGSFGR